MKITLKNFRCYTNQTFDFGKDGIVLLSGPSGVGKTSILSGIYFALFGVGTKIVSYGKSSCSVILEFEEITITRTKRPNRLVVNDEKGEYEDTAGQSIINTAFGDTFKTTGYISQNALDSFIMMSPIDKLGFLEKFSFNDVNLTEIKKRCKDMIKTRHDCLIKSTSQLEVASLMLQELEKPEKVSFPLKCSKKSREKAIKNENTKNKNASTLIKRCKNKLSSLQKEKQNIEVYEAIKKSKEELLEDINEQLADLNIKRDSIKYIGDSKLQEYKNKLLSIISKRELASLESRYNQDVDRIEKMKKDENDSISNKILEIKDNLWKEYSKDEVKSTIEEYKQIIKDLEKIVELNTNIEKYNVDVDELLKNKELLVSTQNQIDETKTLIEKLHLQQQVLECPSCHTNLKFNENKLELYDLDIGESNIEDIDSVKITLSNLKRKISSLQTSIISKEKKLCRLKECNEQLNQIKDQYEELPIINEMKDDMEYIRSYKSSQLESEKQLSKYEAYINNKTYSSTIISLENDITQQEKKIKQTKSNMNINQDEDEDEDTIRHSISIQKQNKEKLEDIDINISKLSKQELQYQTVLNSYKQDISDKYGEIRDIKDITPELNKQSLDLVDLEKKKLEHEENIDNIEKYNQYKKSIDNYNSWVEKVSNLEKEETESRRLYGAATMLKEVILEAESIAMLNIISSINTHTQPYLDCFFSNDPISIKLVPFKESKKGQTIKKKPQINLEIEYKGMEADISILSGGEISRVILSFTLALGEMFNTPIMMLDECTASLDQELTGVVMDGIRENFNGKLVIIIAHQVVTGGFDRIIKV